MTNLTSAACVTCFTGTRCGSFRWVAVLVIAAKVKVMDLSGGLHRLCQGSRSSKKPWLKGIAVRVRKVRHSLHAPKSTS